MEVFPAALAGLASYPQFVLYILAPHPTKPGKTNKFPVDWRDGSVCGVTNRAAWTTCENALAQLKAGRAHGIGFVFDEADPFFFLDIDGALSDAGEWSDLAQWLCKAFPGAAVEVSSSGRGLHIIGSGATAIPADHRCKNTVLGLELYTRERFVALTGTNAVGDVSADMSVVLPWLMENYFPPQAAIDGTVEGWTDGPRDDWRGPTDDEDLLRRAMASRSAAAAFGSKASFADLWTRDVETLRKFWPDASAVDGYGASDADAALASHLAFWTGCDCERMERLMRRSELVRDKWDEARRDQSWLQLTITNAVRVQRDVCRDKEVELPPTAAPAPAAPVADGATPTVRTGETYLQPAHQLQLFAGCVYVQELHRALIPSGALLKPDQFKTTYGGHVYVMDGGNEKTTRDAWEAFTQSNVNACPMADATCFRPDLAPRAILAHDGRRFVNTYTPIDPPRAAGDAGPFLHHLRTLIPDERDRTILLSYMAACVQHKGVKFQWCPLIQGAEGNGKTLFSRCVAAAIGERYTHWPRAAQITAKFNAWMEDKIFIGVEDVYMPEDRGEVIEAIKPMITNDRLEIEGKGLAQRSAWVCANFILNSNHKDAVRKTRNDRRFAPFYTAQQTAEDISRDGLGGDYFPKLYGWLKSGGYAIVSELLHTYAIADEFNPATLCQRAPRTTSTDDAISASLGGVEQEIIEAVEAGASGFLGPWISSTALARLLEKLGRSRSLTHQKREQILKDLGYIKHPALPGGRVNNTVAPDGAKPILFVRVGSPEASITEAADAARAYSRAQGVEFGLAAVPTVPAAG